MFPGQYRVRIEPLIVLEQSSTAEDRQIGITDRLDHGTGILPANGADPVRFGGVRGIAGDDGDLDSGDQLAKVAGDDLGDGLVPGISETDAPGDENSLGHSPIFSQ